MAAKLFGDRIEPACAYCRFGREHSDGQMVLCEKKGVVAPFYACRRYRYAPLKRIPARQTVLPSYDGSEFKL